MTTIDWRRHLTRRPDVCHGRLCAEGTRVMVTVILDNLASGRTPAQLIEDYPVLTPAHVDAAMAYAAELAHEEAELPAAAATA